MSQTIRAVLTRFARRLGDDLEEIQKLSTEEADVEMLKDALKRIQSSCEKIDSKHAEYTKFLRECSEQERVSEGKVYEEYERQPGSFSERLIEAQDAIDTLEREIAKCDQATRKEKKDFSANPIQCTKLPELRLPRFTGDPKEWLSFWDSFSASIDVQNIAPVQKFTYLKSCLGGKAIDVIDGIQMTSENYEVAVNKLRARFGGELLIVRSLYRQIHELPRCQNYTEDLRLFYNKLDKLLNQLRNIGQNINQESIKLSIEEKLPSAALIELSKTEIGRTRNGKAFVSGLGIVDNLMQDLNDYIRLKERLPEFQRREEFSRAKTNGKGKF